MTIRLNRTNDPAYLPTISLAWMAF